MWEEKDSSLYTPESGVSVSAAVGDRPSSLACHLAV